MKLSLIKKAASAENLAVTNIFERNGAGLVGKNSQRTVTKIINGQ